MTNTKYCRSILALLLLAGGPVWAQQPTGTTKPAAADQKASDNLAEQLMPKFNLTRSLKGPVEPEPSSTVHFPVEFDTDSAVLRPQGKKQLDLLAESMSKVRQQTRSFISNKQKLVLRLVGHTDDRGTVEHNDALSRDRAEAAKRYLRETWGFSNDDVVTNYKGKAAPVNAAQPCDDTCRQQNRRVDVQVFIQ